MSIVLEVLSVLKGIPATHSCIYDLDSGTVNALQTFFQGLRIRLLLSHTRTHRERVAQDQNPEDTRWLLKGHFAVAVAMAVCDCGDVHLKMTDSTGLEPVS